MPSGSAAAAAFVTRLRSKLDSERVMAAQELYKYICGELRESSSEATQQFVERFDRGLIEMLSTPEPSDKKGAVLAMVCLMKEEKNAATSVRLNRFTTFLRNLQLQSTDQNVLELLAKAIGHLALASGVYTAGFVDFELKRAFEWLQATDRNESRRLGALLVLKELAKVTPTFFYQQVHQFFDCIFGAIRDQKPVIRETAVGALRAALLVTSQRETRQEHKVNWYRQSYEEAAKCFEEATAGHGSSKEDRAHSGLLIANELLRIANSDGERLRQEVEELHEEHAQWQSSSTSSTVQGSLVVGSYRESENAITSLVYPPKPVLFESRTCRKQVADVYDKICVFALKCRVMKAAHNQRVVLQLLGRLVAFDKETFVRNYLSDALSFALQVLSKEKEKSSAFLTIGLVTMAVQQNVKPHLARIFDAIRACLPPAAKDATGGKRKQQAPPDPAVFTCLALLARALGNEVLAQMKPMLESMFNTEFSPSLTVALREIVARIPELTADIQDGLLRHLSLIIMRRPMLPPPPSDLPSGPVVVAPTDVPATALALSTLGNFNFPRHWLEIFLKYVSAGYLNSDCREIRLEAVRAVCRLLAPSVQTLARAKNKQQHLALLKLIHLVLSKLLTVGVTDPDQEIRLNVFTTMMDIEPFYIHLAQVEMLQLIFLSLQDEEYRIRQAVICLLGKLSDINPAHVMPTLRIVLIQILGELGHSGVSRNEEQSARLLAQLVASSPKFMKPYMMPTLKKLIPKLKEPSSHSDVVISVLNAVGELANVGGVELTNQLDTLFPILLDFLQDSTSLEKREVAVWAMGQIVEGTGYVVEPYHQYPELLGILLRFLKTEQSRRIRGETIRLLGLLGALDPHKQKLYNGGVAAALNSTGLALSLPDGSKDVKDPRQEIIQWFHWERCSLEDFYPAFAIVNLMHMVADPSLSQHHTSVVQAVMYVFSSLGTKCLPYLDQVVPSFLKVIRSSDIGFREFLFQQLGSLISVVKQHIKPYLKDIFSLIKEFWTPQTPMRLTIIMLVEQMAGALGAEFKPYLPEILPAMLRVFMYDNSDGRSVTGKLLDAFKVCSTTLEEHLYMVVPPVVKLLDSPDAPLTVRKSAIETLVVFGETMKLNQYASRIIHALVRVLDECPELRPAAVDLLCTLVVQMERDLLIFRPSIDAVLHKHKVVHNRYEVLLNMVLKDNRVGLDEDTMAKKRSADRRARTAEQTQASEREAKKEICNYDQLKRAWSVSRCVSKEDWAEWLQRFSIQLMAESPYAALRSCHNVAQNYAPLAKELFNAAFVSCWTELPEQYQDELIAALQQAIAVQESPEITQTILNLAEFMDHSEKGPLPIDPKVLGERALRTRAYAKALRYKENEFHAEVGPEVLEALISINNKLQLHEASVGVVEYARRKEITIAIRERWYEKLHDWEKALDAYDRKQEQSPADWDLTLGRMRCMEALAEWGKLHALAKDKWPAANGDTKGKMARMAAAAAWGLCQWDAMEEYVCLINRNTLDGAFYRCVLGVHQDHFQLAQQCADKARDLIDTDLTALTAESYNRSYGTMVQVQMLSELEEAVQYKLVPDRRPVIAQMWWKRLLGCEGNVEDWQRLLQVRSLVLAPQEMRRTWIKFASLCRKNNKLHLSQKTLVMLLNVDPSKCPDYALPADKPELAFAYCKHLWSEGKQELAWAQLKRLVDSALKPQSLHWTADVLEQQELVKLKAKCFLKLGQWREASRADNEAPLNQVIQFYRLATELDRNWYKAWHALARSNFAAVLYYKQQSAQEPLPVPVAVPAQAQVQPQQQPYIPSRVMQQESLMTMHAVQSVQCFFRSIALCQGHSLQDTLRLLTLWFDYGHLPEVYEALVEGVKSVRIETWLQVIPQLIARIDTKRHLVGRLIMQLLMDIGREHAQALVYPLTVAAKSTNLNRQQVANRILKHMGEHCPNLVHQAALVSDELIRVAILWHELWHEGLEEASRQYFAERNVQGMFATLEPLHNIIEQGPTTLKEQSFSQAYYRDLKEARDWCDKYKQSGNVKELTQAWDLYYNVFRRISKQLPQLTSLQLQYVSPQLLVCRNLELAVPGTYDPDKQPVHIQAIHPNLDVITSKQRPRKICVKGSNGQDYWFLLKGHEDPRQDERVMQLFGLVNTLLLQDPATFRRNLTIQRYSVVPLSQNSGLIGWVPNCDTLHALLREYREKKKILLNIEHKLMQRMAPNYDHLMLMQKVEVFEHALEHTMGDDLQKILWLKSPSSEVWFDRRTNYTRSLAAMSAVGYVLGLGDRHPSNLMLDRMSGKIVHIDFGDCFEVAMTREKFPEKIPFRLTRMLVNAMEVTGIEGSFRITCERVMSLLRQNKESVMAVLEAFVYDPLINWRLIENAMPKRTAADPPETVPPAEIVEEGAAGAGDEATQPTEIVSKRALQIVQRIRDKLNGRDFVPTDTLDVAAQVDLLIEQAVSHENLCQCYVGWCPFW